MKSMNQISGVIAILILLSACNSNSYIPVTGVEAVQTNHVYCNERMAWSAEVVMDTTATYSTFWLAFDAATVQDEFKYVDVNVTLDGESVDDSFKFVHAPQSYTVTCSDGGRQFDTSRMKYTLFLPSLPKGEHEIVWTYTITSDSSNYSLDLPLDMAVEYPVAVMVQ